MSVKPFDQNASRRRQIGAIWKCRQATGRLKRLAWAELSISLEVQTLVEELSLPAILHFATANIVYGSNFEQAPVIGFRFGVSSFAFANPLNRVQSVTSWNFHANCFKLWSKHFETDHFKQSETFLLVTFAQKATSTGNSVAATPAEIRRMLFIEVSWRNFLRCSLLVNCSYSRTSLLGWMLPARVVARLSA